MRLDRFITLNLVQPLQMAMEKFRTLNSQLSTLNQSALPILMYHSISDDPETGISPYYRTATSPAVFRQHMELLRSLGYIGVDLKRGLAWLNSSFNVESSKLDVRSSTHRTSQPPIVNRKPEPHSPFPIPQTLKSAPSLSRFVVLTFDDGFRDFYTAAYPILREFGFTATMYLPTAFIGDEPRSERRAPARREPADRQRAEQELGGPADGQPPPPISDAHRGHQPLRSAGLRHGAIPTHQRAEQELGAPVYGKGQAEVAPFPARRTFNGKECLSWSEVRDLHHAGIEFGSHTVNHPKLVDLGWPEIEAELSNSKSEIEDQLGAPVTGFCYPYAFPQADHAFTARLRDVLAAAGYENCVTTILGRAQAGEDSYALPRLPANSNDDDGFLRAKLEGAYDWLAGPQALIKKFKASRRQSGARLSGAAAAPVTP